MLFMVPPASSDARFGEGWRTGTGGTRWRAEVRLASLRRSHLFGVQHIRQLLWQTLLGMLRLRTSAVTIKSRTRSLTLDHRARPLRVWSMMKTTMTDLRRGRRCRRLRSAGRCSSTRRCTWPRCRLLRCTRRASCTGTPSHTWCAPCIRRSLCARPQAQL